MGGNPTGGPEIEGGAPARGGGTGKSPVGGGGGTMPTGKTAAFGGGGMVPVVIASLTMVPSASFSSVAFAGGIPSSPS